MSLEQAKSVVTQSLNFTSITLVTEELKLFSERGMFPLTEPVCA